MSVSANQLIKRAAGHFRSFPVKGSTHLYAGTAVFIDANGYAVAGTGTGVNGFAGIANAEADNSGGSDGDLTIEVFVEGDFELVGAGTYTQANVGDRIWIDDNFTINTSIGTTSVPCGLCVGFINSTTLLVRITPCGDSALAVAPLTTITPADAVGTPDYAIAAVINTSAWGFSNAAEAITLLYCIQNLQKRVLELEKRR